MDSTPPTRTPPAGGVIPGPTKRLANEVRALGLELQEEKAGLLVRHLLAVLDENRRVNLTAFSDPDLALTRLTADSLAIALHLREGRLPKTVVDVGTGGGFPGVPCAILLPDARVYLLDRRRKKAEAAGRAALAVAGNTIAMGGSAEELGRRGGPLHGRADLVLCRAVGPVAEVLESSRPLLAPASTVVIWKGAPLPADEDEDGAAVAARLGLVRLPDLPYEVYRPSVLVRFRRSP